ncbi:hypothetical protein FS837_004201 [Tulasnella sp. UAMH 9824]|nr:hypothetical protein FS837_004201 [Tulasnella sp. UAMH 9824]
MPTSNKKSSNGPTFLGSRAPRRPQRKMILSPATPTPPTVVSFKRTLPLDLVTMFLLMKASTCSGSESLQAVRVALVEPPPPPPTAVRQLPQSRPHLRPPPPPPPEELALPSGANAGDKATQDRPAASPARLARTATPGTLSACRFFRTRFTACVSA